jgi:putative ABC transport system ATP-binding protein
MALIKLKDISKLYGFGDATTLALDEVSLSIEKNEFVAIMGPSGCGKSTLMNIIGLLDRPTHGTYLLNNKSVTRLTQGRRAKIRRDTVGFIFQSYNLLSRLTVLENVALPLAYRGMASGKRLRVAGEMLDRVGLADRTYFYPPQLSGGQVQRVAIARALVNSPRLIIADEPTGNLDSGSSRLVMELLSEIHKAGNTILFVTHNPELTRYASRVVYMRDGVIIQDEMTRVGEIAKTALRQMYSVHETTAEDDLAGISILMKALPQEEAERVQTEAKKLRKARKKTARIVKAASPSRSTRGAVRSTSRSSTVRNAKKAAKPAKRGARR